jgi:hypothetical protein
MAGFKAHEYRETDYDPSKPLFHGTPEKLNPGDVITPREPFKAAYATRNKDAARKFSVRSDKVGQVYQVEPVSTHPEHVWEQNMKYGGPLREVLSLKGYKVLNEVQFKDHS